MNRREELGRILHHEARRCLIGTEGLNPSAVLGWDELSDSTRERDMAMAGAVARAERNRLREAVESLSAVTLRADGESVRVVPAEALLEVLDLREGQ